MTDTLPSAEDRSDPLRRFERRRVEAEVRGSLFGTAAAPLRIDRFEIRRKLGEGAMGIAYAAFDPQLQREVALKLLDVRSAVEAQAALQEARALARVSHANVLTVHEAGLDDGIAFIVSELVSGGTLRTWLAADASRRAPKRLFPVLLAVARGVSAAHQRGIAHRDLKPENVLIGGDGAPRVADFGLAISAAPAEAVRAPSPGRGSPLPGTVAYMAPEQLRGERADPFSDQFGFCVMAFEALFGRLPFEAATAGDLLRAIETGSTAAVSAAHPGRKALPILKRGLALESSARWPSMDELARALARATRIPRAIVVSVVGILVGGLAATAAFFWWREGEEDRLIDRAIGLNQQMRFDDCADLLAREAETDGALQMWVGCAEAARDPRKLEKACDAWPRRTKLARPAVCAPFLRKARALRTAGRFRECVDTIFAEPSTIAATPTLSACMESLPREAALARRMCKYLEGLKPPKERTANCDAGVQSIK